MAVKTPDWYKPRGDEANLKDKALQSRINRQRDARNNPNRGGGAGKTGVGFLQDTPSSVTKWMGKGKIDDAPNAIKGQLTLNEYTANTNDMMNRPDEFTPYGQQTYSRDPETGRVTRRFELSEGQKGIDTAQTNYDRQAIGGAARSLGQFQNQGQFSYGGIPQVMGANDLMGARQGVENRLNQAWEQRNAPMFDQQRGQLEQRLRDQGLNPSSPAWSQQMNQFQQGVNDARNQAQAMATGQGLGEMQGLHGMSLANRQNATGEYGTQYFAPMNAAQSQLQGVRGVVQPNFTPMANIDVGRVDIPGTYSTYKGLDFQQQQIDKMGMAGGGGGGGTNWGQSAINAMLGGVSAGSPTSAAAGSNWGQGIANFGTGFGNAVAFGQPGKGFFS